jgi:phage terminase small subunit
MIKSPSGYPVQSPYLAIANRQTDIMMRIASEFGFTPASRSRVTTPADDRPSLFDILDEDSIEETDVEAGTGAPITERLDSDSD